MCFICKNKVVYEIYGKCIKGLTKREEENPGLVQLTDLDRLHGVLGMSEFSIKQSEYMEFKWILSLITRFKYRTNVFQVKKDTICKEHKELAKSLIERNIIIPKNGESYEIGGMDYL